MSGSNGSLRRCFSWETRHFYWHILHGEIISWAFQYSQAIIPFTKNEYPLFTLFLGDVHAHLFGMFNQAFLIFLLIFAYTKWESLEDRGKWIVIGMTALSLGSMPLINMWNVFTYAPLVLLCGVLCWRKHRSLGSAGRDPRIYILLVPVLSVALYLPNYIQMGSDTLRGIGIVSTPSDPFQFLQIFGFFIAVFVAYTARDLIQRPYLLFIPVLLWVAGHGAVAVIAVPLMGLIARRGQTAAEMIAIWGLVVVAVCEIVYLKDVYINEYYRFNTVFKLFFDGWILIGTASLLLIGAWLARRRFFNSVSTTAYRSAAVLMVAALLIVPWAANVDFGRDVLRIEFDSGYHTLDGSAYLEGAHPGDAAALRYFASAPKDTRIAEAVNGDYTYSSRISSFTGIPTILGQPTHEYHWRGNEDNWYTTRRDDIKTIYEEPNQTVAIMEKYGITHIYVGELEHSVYNVSLPVSALESVYHESGVIIYRRRAI